MSITGSNTLSGDIANAPSGLTSMSITGSNTLSGDIANAPSGLTSMDIRGSNTITSTGTWGGSAIALNTFRLLGVGLTEAATDNVLLALTGVTGWVGPRIVDVSGNNAAPSATGLGYRATILSNGAAVVMTN
jgi:hypothetical protein